MQALLMREKGDPRPLDAVAELPPDGFLWLDFDREAEPDWHLVVGDLVGHSIYDNHLQDSLSLEHPSFADVSEQYEMVIFRSLAPQDGSLTIDTRPTAFFLFERLLVTVRQPGSRSVERVRQRLLGGHTRIPRRPAGLMHLTLSAMVDLFLDLRQRLTEQLDRWQADLLDPANPFNDWMMLLRHKAELRRLEMLSEEQQEALNAWTETTHVHLDAYLKVRLRDLQEHIQRVLNHSQQLQSQVESLVQMHFSAVAHRTNEIMRVLTVLSAIFLPLTFIAGIFGMNFVNMPDTQHPMGYFIALGGMAVLAIVLFVVFKRRRWF